MEKGPRYLPLLNSSCIMSLKTMSSSSVEGLLGGVKERSICGMPAKAPRRMYMGICRYFEIQSEELSSCSQLSVLGGVSRVRLLCERAALSTMSRVSTARAFMVVPHGLVSAANSLVPIETEGAVFSINQATLIGAGTASFGMSVPKVGCLAPLDGVTLAAEAYWTCRECRRFGGAGGLPKPTRRSVFGRSRPGGSRMTRSSVKLPCPAPIPVAVLSVS